MDKSRCWETSNHDNSMNSHSNKPLCFKELKILKEKTNKTKNKLKKQDNNCYGPGKNGQKIKGLIRLMGLLGPRARSRSLGVWLLQVNRDPKRPS